VIALHENGSGDATRVVTLGAPDTEVERCLVAHGVEPAASWESADDCLAADSAAVDAVVISLLDGQPSDGVDLRALSEHHGGAPVVAVVSDLSRRAQRAVMRLGAHAILVVADVERALIPTIAAVCSGQVVVPSALRFHFETPVLSYREKQVLGLVVMGFTNAEIARKLFLAESTVKSHLSSAFEKLGVRSRREAAELIVDGSNGLGSGILAITDPAARVSVAPTG
jgi:DNA-binding NarL/FixJ family response regulator